MSSEHIVSRIKEINSRIQEIESICSPQKPKTKEITTAKNEKFSEILQEIVKSKHCTNSNNLDLEKSILANKTKYTAEMWNSEIEAASLQTDVDADLIRAIIRAESSYNPSAESPAGALGLMQLMPSTANSVGVNNILDPQENILGGAKYLKELLGRYNGDIIKSIAAYNAGTDAVDRANGIPSFDETKTYVPKVLSHYYALRHNK